VQNKIKLKRTNKNLNIMENCGICQLKTKKINSVLSLVSDKTINMRHKFENSSQYVLIGASEIYEKS
jgi:hypothetical protein